MDGGSRPDDVFLAVAHESITPTTWRPLDSFVTAPHWSAVLNHACRCLRLTVKTEPGWLLVHELD
ncbi:hypothetical protein AB0J01_28170 [Streptomyces sp. NPDC050204]|uniref:hypothetical protein n=1 Tax=Streptomyces sp. NPDC050204 TaxID=3155514 RepID=UPI00343CF720